MLRISACAITKNEERNLPRWIGCVARLADEIVVVDTGSTDRTVAMARAAGAKVFSFDWRDDFAAAKNYALDRATGDWVVFLDADEYFPPEDCPKVRETIRRFHREKPVAGLVCRWVNVDEERGNEVQNVGYQIRIFRRRPTLRYVGAVHESLRDTSPEGSRMQFVEEFSILHTGYAASVMPEKVARDLRILLARRARGEGEASDDFYLADCYYALGDYEKTIAHAKKAIASGVRLVGRDNRPYALWIQSLVALRRPLAEIEEAVDKARRAHPAVGDFCVLGGIGAFEAGDFARAVSWLQEAVSLYGAEPPEEERLLVTDERQKFLPQAYRFLGLLALRQGREGDALDFFSSAVRLAPYQAEFLAPLCRLLRKVPAADAVQLLNQFYRLPSDAALLAEQLWTQGAATAALYYERQAGGVFSDFDRYAAAGRNIAAAAMASDRAEALAAVSAAMPPGKRPGDLAALLSVSFRTPSPKKEKRLERLRIFFGSSAQE